MAKHKGRRPTAKQIASKGTFTVGERTEPIPAAVWGQLEPLDRVAREMTERWGDTLPSLVTPDLGRHVVEHLVVPRSRRALGWRKPC